MSSATVKLYAIVGGNPISISSVRVTQSAYGIADTFEITTPLSLMTFDLPALSQTTSPLPLQIQVSEYSFRSSVAPLNLLLGLVDEIDIEEDTNLVTIHGRGVLASLIDARISVKANMNDTISNVITQIIKRYSGLTPVVTHSSVPAGTILRNDYVAMSRNLRAMDFINILARSQGWYSRVVGGNIVVGPPPDPSQQPVFNKDFGRGNFIKLKFTHNALHNKNIKVKVVSYIPSTKQRALSKQGPVAKLLGLPQPLSKTKTPVGRTGIVSGTQTVGERDNVEEYVIPEPGLTQQQCDDMSLTVANEINRHEFVCQATYALGPNELQSVVQSSPEFSLQISGATFPSCNGLYFNRHVNWSWDLETDSGLLLETEMLNHVLPTPTGSQANSTGEMF